MAPDIGTMVATMLRALEEVVLPAIDSANKPATQQARLCILNLKMIAAQHDKTYHLAVTELQLFAKLLRDLQVAASDAIEPILQKELDVAIKNELNTLRIPSTGLVESTTRSYREIADAVLESPGVLAHQELRRRIAEVVMKHCAKETLMRRAWNAPSGFESDPGALPSLDEVIAPVTMNTDVAD